jgi:hypothetical protein
MGGNTTNRIDWCENKIHDLVCVYRAQDHEFYNPITNKILKSKKAWKNSLAVKMSFNSTNLFFFLLEPPHFSQLSNDLLTINDYNYRRGGFSKYTKQEISKKLYHKLRDYTIISNDTKHKISNTLKNYNTTELGIESRLVKSIRMRQFYSTEEGRVHKNKSSIKQSNTLKVKIQNGEFTPPITNTWTHWKAYIFQGNETLKFRSSWEACFWFCNQNLEYESIRIKGKNKTYISDFYDPYANTLYEIKTCNRYNIEIDKMNTIINYCISNNIKFVWINEKNISEYIKEEIIYTNDSAIEQYKKLKKAYDYNIKN